MAYTKTAWQEMQAAKKNKFNKSEETAASVVLTHAPEGVTQAGTPYSVENMNKMEQGIYDAHEAITALQQANDGFGYLISFPFIPSAALLLACRALPLAGQPVLISDYQRLCDAAYAGDAANATADWWYKTADPEGTIRDPSGQYMRVLDHRGVFSRAAGPNSKYKMANNTPYDGISIGRYISDAFQNFGGEAYAYLSDTGNIFMFAGFSGALRGSGNTLQSNQISAASMVMGQASLFSGFHLNPDNDPNARIAAETRSASISSYYCIKY
jgi:hypothetical protein